MSYRLVQMASAEGAEVENTATEGSLCRKAFAANELLPGKIYGFEAGIVVNDNNGTDTLTLAVRFGTSGTPGSNTAIAVSAAVDVADADVAIVRGTIHVQSPTRYVFMVEMSEPDAIATISMKCQGPKLFAGVANTAYNLDVTALWSGAHADNEVAAMSFAVWEIS